MPAAFGNPAGVISFIPRGNADGSPRGDGSLRPVIEAGSFSGAAKQLHVGQPAVSKTIAQLEDRLGARLLRSSHGLTPTEAGRDFYERAKRSIEEADEAEIAARGAAPTLSGRLRVPPHP